MLRFLPFLRKQPKQSELIKEYSITWAMELEAGTLKVVSIRDTLSNKKFFWRDAYSTQGFGPFSSCAEALEDYKKVVSMFNAMPGKAIINIDFTNKKRV